MNLVQDPSNVHIAQLSPFDDVVAALARGPDVSEVFERLCTVARRLVPHDEAHLLVGSTDLAGSAFTHLASTREGIAEHVLSSTPDEFVCSPEPGLLNRIPGRERGLHSGLTVPVRIDEHCVGVFVLLSGRPQAYSAGDLTSALHLADYLALAVSHEQLAEIARQVGEARARAEHLETRVRILSDELESRTHVRVVGESPEWRDVLKQATQVAATDTTVLVSGESGTGKEVIARFIYGTSARRKGPFVTLNCAALPEQMLESELFGYEPGTCTSAQQSKPGQIELASGGVLFLDEITEMSVPAQAKLLRVLQEREFQRLGGTRVLKANVRVIAATNRNLRTAIERREFREDLYYRLQVFEIRIPPLRERRADILLLSEAFLHEIGRSFGRAPARLTRPAREALLRHGWPGNVRELRNALERAAMLCEGGLIDTPHLSLQSAHRPALTATTDLSDIERETIAQVLRECRWNKSKAAQRLGLSRTQLYGRVRKYGLEPPPMS